MIYSYHCVLALRCRYEYATMHAMVRERITFINIVISLGLFWSHVTGSTVSTKEMGDPSSTIDPTTVANRPSTRWISVGTTKMSDPSSTIDPTTVENRPSTTWTAVRLLQDQMFDMQICPFPQQISTYKINYGFQDSECFVPKVEQTAHYKKAVDECNGRLACDRCNGLEAQMNDHVDCEHNPKDYVELKVECLVDETRSWGMSMASAGNTFEPIICPNKMIIQIIHLFYGVRNTSEQSAFCWHVLKFQNEAPLKEIENKCNGQSACEGIVAISDVMAGACGRNEAVESTDMAVVYDCLHMRDHSPPASCPSSSSEPSLIAMIAGAAGGVVLIVIIIVTTILVLRKRSTVQSHTIQAELDPESKNQNKLNRSVSNDYRRSPTAFRDEYMTTEDICYATVDEDEENYDEIQFADDDPEPGDLGPSRVNSLVEGGDESVGRALSTEVRPCSGYLQTQWQEPSSNVTGGNPEDEDADEDDIQIDEEGAEIKLEVMPYVL